MISYLRGKIEEVFGDTVTVDVNGVGYEVSCTRKLLDRLTLGIETSFPVVTEVREDSIRLFGMNDRAERRVFLLLGKVSGLGPKSCLDIISSIAPQALLRAIGSGDLAVLTSIKGVGKKKAERIVVELKDIVAQFSTEWSVGGEVPEDRRVGLSPEINDAVLALEALGFARRDAEKAVQEAMKEAHGGGTGELVREALRFV